MFRSQAARAVGCARNRACEPTAVSVKRSEPELSALMRLAQSGDAAAYRLLLERLSRLLRRYFRRRLARMGRSVADAEDLMQDTLVAIHTRRHTYDPAQPFTPWMHAIAHYKLVDHARRTSAAMSDVPLETAGEIVAPYSSSAVDSGLDVSKLLAQLPERSRSIIRDTKLHGLSIAETAARHDM